MPGGLDAQLMLTYGLVFLSCSILQHISAALLLPFLPLVVFFFFLIANPAKKKNKKTVLCYPCNSSLCLCAHTVSLLLQ